jgi:hypothetical protein
MIKKIKFAISSLNPDNSSINEELKNANMLFPAKSSLPKWFKDTPTLKIGKPDDKKNFKNCAIFTDSFLTGYMLTTVCDIEITLVPGQMPNVKMPYEIFTARESSTAGEMPLPKGYHDIHFSWMNVFHLKAPKGYSLLITHPFNRHDLPFYTLTGVVDADGLAMGPGLMPFFLKSDFQGIIPKGTPFAQVVPIKRESWIAEKDESLIKDDWKKTIYLFRSSFAGDWYKKLQWSKKDYN